MHDYGDGTELRLYDDSARRAPIVPTFLPADEAVVCPAICDLRPVTNQLKDERGLFVLLVGFDVSLRGLRRLVRLDFEPLAWRVGPHLPETPIEDPDEYDDPLPLVSPQGKWIGGGNRYCLDNIWRARLDSCTLELGPTHFAYRDSGQTQMDYHIRFVADDGGFFFHNRDEEYHLKVLENERDAYDRVLRYWSPNGSIYVVRCDRLVPDFDDLLFTSDEGRPCVFWMDFARGKMQRLEFRVDGFHSAGSDFIPHDFKSFKSYCRGPVASVMLRFLMASGSSGYDSIDGHCSPGSAVTVSHDLLRVWIFVPLTSQRYELRLVKPSSSLLNRTADFLAAHVPLDRLQLPPELSELVRAFVVPKWQYCGYYGL
jgi:hypothetical protein